MCGSARCRQSAEHLTEFLQQVVHKEACSMYWLPCILALLQSACSADWQQARMRCTGAPLRKRRPPRLIWCRTRCRRCWTIWASPAQTLQRAAHARSSPGWALRPGRWTARSAGCQVIAAPLNVKSGLDESSRHVQAQCGCNEGADHERKQCAAVPHNSEP